MDGGGDNGATPRCADQELSASGAGISFKFDSFGSSINGLSASSAPVNVEGPAGNSNLLPTTLGLSFVISSTSCSLPDSLSLSNLWEAIRFLGCSTLGGGLGREATEAVRLSFLGDGIEIGDESSIAQGYV